MGFRTCHIEIIRSLSKSFSSYFFDIYHIVHHQPHNAKKQNRKYLFESKPNPCSYIPTKPSSALPPNIPRKLSLTSSLFLPRAAVRRSPRVAWSSCFSDVTKRQLYHRVLNCTSVTIPGRLYLLKYYTPCNMGMGELRVKIEHKHEFKRRALGVMGLLMLCY